MPQDQTQDSAEVTASWWAALHQLEERVDRRMAEGDARMTSMQADIAENTRVTAETKKTTDEIKATTDEIREFLNTMKSLLKLGNMMSSVTIKVAKPISYVATIVAAVATAWTVFRSGK